MKKNKDDTIIDLDADQVIEESSKPDPVEPVVKNAKPSPKRSWLIGTVALLAAAVAGGWAYRDVLSNYMPSDQVQGLSEKIVVLEKQNTDLSEKLRILDTLSSQLKIDVDAVESKGATLAQLAEKAQKAQSEAVQKFTDLEQSLIETKQGLSDIAARPITGGGTAVVDTSAVAALQQRIESLEKDVASLKATPVEAPDNTAALSQSLSDLKAKVSGGTGFREEFDRVQRMVPAAAGLDVLQQYATLGIPDSVGLGTELKGIIATLPKPIVPGPVPESEGWWAGILNSLSDLITIRVEGEVDWPSTASAAAAFAESGDLPQAIEHLNAAEGVKPVGVQQWIDRAQARLSVDKALQSVEEAVLRVIAAKG